MTKRECVESDSPPREKTETVDWKPWLVTEPLWRKLPAGSESKVKVRFVSVGVLSALGGFPRGRIEYR